MWFGIHCRLRETPSGLFIIHPLLLQLARCHLGKCTNAIQQHLSLTEAVISAENGSREVAPTVTVFSHQIFLRNSLHRLVYYFWYIFVPKQNLLFIFLFVLVRRCERNVKNNRSSTCILLPAMPLGHINDNVHFHKSAGSAIMTERANQTMKCEWQREEVKTMLAPF